MDLLLQPPPHMAVDNACWSFDVPRAAAVAGAAAGGGTVAAVTGSAADCWRLCPLCAG